MSEGLLAALGVAFVAFDMWLAVRIVNRRERCVKRGAIALPPRVP